MHTLALALASRGVSADSISIAGMIAAALAGLLLSATGDGSAGERWMLAGAAILIQLRLLANLLDGLVAVEGGRKSPLGDLYNEVPDRISDAAILIGAGYAVTSSELLGWASALVAVLVAYIRVVGRSLGLPGDYRGPMAKQQRMFLVTLAALALAAAPAEWRRGLVIAGHELGWMACTLALIIAGCLITMVRRLVGIARQLRAGATLP